MEYALEGFTKKRECAKAHSLNPCFSGICSRRTPNRSSISVGMVLILVLVEYALEVLMMLTEKLIPTRLNPCFNGICSRSAQTNVRNNAAKQQS